MSEEALSLAEHTKSLGRGLTHAGRAASFQLFLFWMLGVVAAAARPLMTYNLGFWTKRNGGCVRYLYDV
jgi:hypothetical protein